MPRDNTTHAVGESLPESAWTVVERTATHIESYAWLDNDKTMKIMRRQLIADDELQKINTHLFDTSRRYSQREAGAMGTPIANIPMSVMFNPNFQLAEKIREGDKDHMTHFLNSERGQQFRSFKGKE